MKKEPWEIAADEMGMTAEEWEDFISAESAKHPTKIIDGYAKFVKKSRALSAKLAKDPRVLKSIAK